MNINFKRIILDIEKTLYESGIHLASDDIIAGGFVRDKILVKEVGDIDIFSPIRDGSRMLFEPDYLLRVGAKFNKKVIQGESRLYDAVYAYGTTYPMGKHIIDHKFHTMGADMTESVLANMFTCSICQCTYSRDNGLYMSAAFQRTVQTKVITFDPAIKNWNGEDGKPFDYHAKKMQKKFPDYMVEELPVPVPVKADSPTTNHNDDDDYGS